MPSTREKKVKSSILAAQDFGQLPKYKQPVYGKPQKVDDMYPLKGTGHDNHDVQKGIDKVLGPLSLFAPFTHEDVPDPVAFQLERPVTPIDDEIKCQPPNFEKLARYVRRRIQAKANVPYLSTDDQKNLAGIIIGEVNGIWPDMRRQIDDPFLSPEQNKELNRRIAVHIVTVCEQLFNHYLEKALVLNSRGVFSGPANMSRLKAQLALEANELLDMLKIRRYIVHDMRTPEEDDDDLNMSQKSPRPSRTASGKKLTYQAMLEASRPKPKKARPKMSSMELEIREIQDKIPTLDTSHLLDFVAELPLRDLTTPSDDGHARPSRISEGVSRMSGVSKEDVSKRKVIYKSEESIWSEESSYMPVRRTKSQPDLCQGENLLEELGISRRVRQDLLIDNELKVLKRERLAMKKVLTDRVSKPGLGTREFIQEDLKRLTEHKDDEFPDGDDEEDLPPLIQAITRHARHDDIKVRMEKQLKELEEKEKERQEEECVFVQGPEYPQPDTVTTNAGKNGVVRTSDIRVSERVCMSSITLKCYSTVYNDLIEEIDPLTVKSLDKNLFLSAEIRDVYKEIMRSVPAKHLELDDMSDKDPLVLHAPDSVNVGGTMASASLARKSDYRVINPAFDRNRRPPWGSAQMNEWAKTPMNPPKNFEGKDQFNPMDTENDFNDVPTPNIKKITEKINTKNEAEDPMAKMMANMGMANPEADKTSRTYASWLQWWKATVSSDDYMKYLSTLETDYMGAVFHFYDSGDDSDGEEEELTARGRFLSRVSHRSSMRGAVTSVMKERRKKMEELKKIKADYKSGFWNANAVLMGGLGKDPELAEDKPEDKPGDRSTRSMESSRSVKSLTLKDKASQLRAFPEKRDLFSRMSKATATNSEAAGSNPETLAAEEAKKAPAPQERLESVWQQLQMPDALRLDMAIKYSCEKHFTRLQEAIERWELIAELVLQREALLTKLEKFERAASDPNRFFSKDSKNSTKRLHESRKRIYFQKRIEALDSEIKEEIEYIKDKFQDKITFKGRPYLDKMKWDRTEMLYWLSEERKKQGMQFEAISKGVNLPLRHAQLQPILNMH